MNKIEIIKLMTDSPSLLQKHFSTKDQNIKDSVSSSPHHNVDNSMGTGRLLGYDKSYCKGSQEITTFYDDLSDLLEDLTLNQQRQMAFTKDVWGVQTDNTTSKSRKVLSNRNNVDQIPRFLFTDEEQALQMDITKYVWGVQTDNTTSNFIQTALDQITSKFIQTTPSQSQNVLSNRNRENQITTFYPTDEQWAQQSLAINPKSIRQDGRTRVMIRNVPKEYTQQDLEDEMRMLGLSHTYHKLYIPPNQSVKENVVYAFVHLNSVEMLEQFYQKLDVHRWLQALRAKRCKLSYSRKNVLN